MSVKNQIIMINKSFIIKILKLIFHNKKIIIYMKISMEFLKNYNQALILIGILNNFLKQEINSKIYIKIAGNIKAVYK